MNQINKNLANKIIMLAHIEQVMRKNSTWNEEVDKRNTQELKKIVKRYGWPDNKLVGKKGSYAAWLLIQHGYNDLVFQKQCLERMKEKAALCLIANEQVAFLEDRILVTEGKWQLYGTQFYKNKRGIFKERPIKDRRNLNIRLKQMGMEPFFKYKREMITNL